VAALPDGEVLIDLDGVETPVEQSTVHTDLLAAEAAAVLLGSAPEAAPETPEAQAATPESPDAAPETPEAQAAAPEPAVAPETSEAQAVASEPPDAAPKADAGSAGSS
jgi:hypothetical protein